MLSIINNTLKKRPFLISLLSNTFKAGAADLITQKYVEQKHEIDKKRLLTFSFFGFSYLGGWQYFLFNKLFVRCETLMKIKGFSNYTQSIVLTGIDMGIHTPFMYFPTFYALKGWIEKESIDTSIQNMKMNLYDDIKAMWSLWIPAQFCNFVLLPLHLRMPFITSVSFIWTIILSMTRGN